MLAVVYKQSASGIAAGAANKKNGAVDVSILLKINRNLRLCHQISLYRQFSFLPSIFFFSIGVPKRNKDRKKNRTETEPTYTMNVFFCSLSNIERKLKSLCEKHSTSFMYQKRIANCAQNFDHNF